jgi:hypothetical protein
MPLSLWRFSRWSHSRQQPNDLRPFFGCQPQVSFQGKTTDAVVGDIGPRHKLGELSVACAKALDIPHSPISGGVDDGVHNEIIPGQPAVVNGLHHIPIL